MVLSQAQAAVEPSELGRSPGSSAVQAVLERPVEAPIDHGSASALHRSTSVGSVVQN